jgi:hypothetical protein
MPIEATYEPYTPLAYIWCLRCGAREWGPAGSRICGCPLALMGFVGGVAVSGRRQLPRRAERALWRLRGRPGILRRV